MSSVQPHDIFLKMALQQVHLCFASANIQDAAALFIHSVSNFCTGLHYDDYLCKKMKGKRPDNEYLQHIFMVRESLH